MKRCLIVTIATVITALLAMILSCSDHTDSVLDSLIQVKMLSYETGILEIASYGAVFYDKYNALTVIDYERYNTESIEIITSDNNTYEVSLEAVDSLSGLAVLKIPRPMNVHTIPIGSYIREVGNSTGQDNTRWNWRFSHFLDIGKKIQAQEIFVYPESIYRW